jgi:transcription initiation factor IIE alpha subunit
MGFTSDSAQTFAVIMANLIDYDNAYRLRFEDTMSETSKEKLQNPRKEIKRLLEIMRSREVRPGDKGRNIHYKFKVFAYLLSSAMLIPKVKRAFLKAVDLIDLKKMGLDDTDTYWVCLRCDYKYMGMTDTERLSYAQSKAWTYPSPMVE